MNGFQKTVRVALVAAGMGMVAPAMAAPWVEYTMDPALPGQVMNPGGLFTGWCIAHFDNSVPDRLEVRIVGPDGGVLSTWESIDTFEYTVFFVVTDGMEDGVYRYQIDYFSEIGLEASVDEAFMVAGLQQGICGMKFEDLNGNGTREASEPWLSGWEMCVDHGVGCGLTTTDGFACWRGFPAGVYTICETPQSGWEATTPVCQSVLVESGPLVKVLFGNRRITTPVETISWGRIKSTYR
jgi:hypothetical protein